MKAVATTILLLIALCATGQANYRFDSSTKAIDSLFERLTELALSVESHDSKVSIPSSGFKYKITTYGSDSSSISFFSQSSQLIFRQVNRYDRQGCRSWEVNEIYNVIGKLAYWEIQKRSCLKQEDKTDPEAIYFDALMYEKGRFVYDSIGRIEERVWLYTPLNAVRRYKYAYSNSGGQTYTMTKHDYDSFWE